MPDEADKTNNPEEAEPFPIDCEVLLLVEGKDDENFFSALIEKMGIENIQIHAIEGIDKLKRFIRQLVRESDFEIVKGLGIILDADNRPPASAMQSIRSSLEGIAGLSAPQKAGELFGDEVKTGVFILPDNQSPGMLETLIWKVIKDEAMRECIDQFAECAESVLGENLDRPDKSRVHAYIATKPKPNVSVGVAAQRGYWDFDHPAFSDIKDFVAQLSQAPAGG